MSSTATVMPASSVSSADVSETNTPQIYPFLWRLAVADADGILQHLRDVYAEGAARFPEKSLERARLTSPFEGSEDEGSQLLAVEICAPLAVALRLMDRLNGRMLTFANEPPGAGHGIDGTAEAEHLTAASLAVFSIYSEVVVTPLWQLLREDVMQEAWREADVREKCLILDSLQVGKDFLQSQDFLLRNFLPQEVAAWEESHAGALTDLIETVWRDGVRSADFFRTDVHAVTMRLVPVLHDVEQSLTHLKSRTDFMSALTTRVVDRVVEVAQANISLTPSEIAALTANSLAYLAWANHLQQCVFNPEAAAALHDLEVSKFIADRQEVLGQLLENGVNPRRLTILADASQMRR